jgi:hypothetical protein
VPVKQTRREVVELGMKRWGRVLSLRLQGRYGVFWLAGIAGVISLPALRLPLEMDDLWLPNNYARGPFSMIGGADPSEVAAAKANGGLAWWADDALRLNFFRPLASLSHYLEFRLWPQSVWLMHATNIVLYVLLVALAAGSYRLLARSAGVEVGAAPLIASVAGLFFVLDDAHAPSVGWISARNSLLAACFSLASVWTHLRWSIDAWKPGRWLSPLAFALGLLSGESGLQAAAYLVAYAVMLDTRRRTRRWLVLLPHGALLVLWAVYYQTHGYGAHGSDWYRRPSLAAIGGGLADSPLWFGSSLVASFATLSLFADAALIRVVWLGALALVAPPLIAALRASPLARFYALGLLLCFVPLSLTQPQDRLLLSASFGAAGWLSLAWVTRGAMQTYARRAAYALGVLHLGVSPLLYLVGLGQAEPVTRSSAALAHAFEGSSGRDVIMVNLPIDILSNLARSQRQARGLPVPRATYVLYAGGSQLQVTRSGPRELVIEAQPGWLANPFERIIATLTRGYHAGQHWPLSSMSVDVLHVDARRAPDRVRFTFPSELEDPSRAWLCWRGIMPVVWQPPKLGERVQLPALSVLRSLTPRSALTQASSSD